MSRFLLLFIILFQADLAIGFSRIDRSEAVEIGGIKQWIQIKGDNEVAPVLLFLHGGPGNSSMSYGERFTNELQKYFIVVQWDQRESGKTAPLNPSDKPHTVSLFVNDTVELIRYLNARFSKKKIYLVGHSWGGYLGLRVAALHPELLKVYFALSPMVNQLESERLSLELFIKKAQAESNKEALQELSQVKVPFQNGLQLFYHRKWLNKMMNSKVPGKEYVESWALRWLELYNEAAAYNFPLAVPEFQCPVIFLLGRNDYQTNAQVAEEYYHQLKAPQKNLVWFEHSAHSPNLTESQKFQETIIKYLTNNE